MRRAHVAVLAGSLQLLHDALRLRHQRWLLLLLSSGALPAGAAATVTPVVFWVAVTTVLPPACGESQSSPPLALEAEAPDLLVESLLTPQLWVTLGLPMSDPG